MRFGLTSRIAILCAVLAVVAVGRFIVLTGSIQHLRAVEQSDARAGKITATARGLENQLIDLETGLRGFLLTDQREFLAPFTAALASYPGQARELSRLTSGDPSAHQRAAAIAAAITGYVRSFSLPTL